jgi:N-acetylneuraminic acid mutarotase
LTWDTASHQVLIKKDFPALPTPCAYLSATLLKNKVYVAGGQSSVKTGEELHNFWELDLLDKTPWKRLPPWPGQPVYGAILAASPASKRILLCGGKSGETYLCESYLFDLQKQGGTWEKIHPLPRPALLAPYVMINNHLLVFGGSDGHDIDRIPELKDKYIFRKDIVCYDIRKNHWYTVGALPIPVVNTNALLWNDAIVIPGGENHPSIRTDILQVTGSPKNLDQCLQYSENPL